MITKNLGDVLFRVDIHDVYTILKKKPQLFAGYAVVNMDENKVLHTVSERYTLKTNEYLIESVRKFYPDILFDFAHYDNNKSYFHIYFTIQSKVTGLWQWAIEIINAYNGKTAPKINLAFKHLEKKLYVYTNVTAMILPDKVKLNGHKLLAERLNEQSLNMLAREKAFMPKRYVHLLTPPKMDILAAVAEWQNSSHPLARDWMAETIGYYAGNFNLNFKGEINGTNT